MMANTGVVRFRSLIRVHHCYVAFAPEVVALLSPRLVVTSLRAPRVGVNLRSPLATGTVSTDNLIKLPENSCMSLIPLIYM